MSDESGRPDELDESGAERLLAGFRYGAGTGAPSNAGDAAELPDNGSHRGLGRSGAGQRFGAIQQNTVNTETAALSGRPTGPAEGRHLDVPEQLHRLLAAAAAPAHPHELRGYESARRAFEAAGSVAVSTSRSRSRSPGRHASSGPLARIAGVKIAALAGALTVAGVAVAAEADILPNPIQRAAHRVLGGVGVPDPESGEHDPVTSASQLPGSSGGPHAAHPLTPTTHASGTDLPGATGTAASAASPDAHPGTLSSGETLDLCRAYAGSTGGSGSTALPPGQRRKLADLAGGDQYVDAFCARVLASATAGAPTTPSASAPAPTGPVTPTRTHPTSHDPRSAPSTDPIADANANGTVSAVRKTH